MVVDVHFVMEEVRIWNELLILQRLFKIFCCSGSLRVAESQSKFLNVLNMNRLYWWTQLQNYLEFIRRQLILHMFYVNRKHLIF